MTSGLPISVEAESCSGARSFTGGAKAHEISRERVRKAACAAKGPRRRAVWLLPAEKSPWTKRPRMAATSAPSAKASNSSTKVNPDGRMLGDARLMAVAGRADQVAFASMRKKKTKANKATAPMTMSAKYQIPRRSLGGAPKGDMLAKSCGADMAPVATSALASV